MVILDRISHYLNQVLIWIAGLFLVAMIALTCANVFLRFVWIPVSGTFELMGYFGAVLTAFALGYTQIRRGHIAVDIVVKGFSKRTQTILGSINSIVCTVFFALAAWQISKYANNLWETGEVTETLQIIYYPFAYAVAFGCAVLSLVFLIEFLKLLAKEEGE
ncbi:MAG: TRAP transporter small permease [Deltaproteobacteria bacterium]|nr:TRAP transporter small permease [Deltaproteobacteria bacterium]MBW2047617.1 TRAP transporter small permease [Deltaproteobacteria bacterium]MBW2110632.1 TRAP transporter small permease [Deltaproteobacteria bacterium]MBW2351964.1 TRAP transporter small permease [Deltaproteobacteria bacterium]HDZ89738.1 TRAP transporter small permease [Deltaproteobacteria bacterium]